MLSHAVFPLGLQAIQANSVSYHRLWHLFFPFQVAAINAEIVDSAMAMKTLTHFFLGLTNEWLESMSTMLDADKADGSSQGGSAPKDSFPIQVRARFGILSL